MTTQAKPQAPSFKLFTKSGDIEKAITSIKGRSAKLDLDIHKAAASVCRHAHEHGDVTVAQKLAQSLISALGRGVRRNAVLDYMQHFGPLKVDESGKNLEYDKASRLSTPADIEANTKASIEKSVWEFKPEQPFHVVDLDDALTKLIAKADKAVNDGDARHNVDPAKLAKLRSLVGVA